MSRLRSLRGVLTRNMIILQAIVVFALPPVAAIPIVKLIADEQGLDEGVIQTIAGAVRRAPDGTLQLTDSPPLADLRSNYPHFWFFATDGKANSVNAGNVPVETDGLVENLSRVNSANVSDIGSAETPVAIIRRHDSEAGTLWIITGGGPPVGLNVLIEAFSSPIFGALLLLLTAASLLVIPRFVKHQLKGLDDLSAEADRIDVNQRGT